MQTGSKSKEFNNRNQSHQQTDMPPSLGKVQPQVVEVEKPLLGLCMMEPDGFTNASEHVNADCFYLDSHKKIFRVMARLSSRSQPIDIQTVSVELKKDGELENVGGDYYIHQLTNHVVSAAPLKHYCHLIIEAYTSRELIALGSKVMSGGFTEDPFELMDSAEKRLAEIRNLTEKRNYKGIDQLLVEEIQHLEKIRHREEALTGVTSGFRELDMVTCGWQPTDLIILAARPSVGKTALALNLIMNAAKAGNPIGFFSLEMGDRQLIQRVLSAESGLYMWNIRNGKMDESQMKHLFEKGVVPLSKTKVFIDDTARIKFAELRSKARRMVQKDGVKMIVVDYLQLVRADERQSRKDLEIGEISAGLKAIAKELNIPVIALAQLSRDVEKRGGAKEPVLSDLKESGAIEQDADMVMFLWKPTDDEIKENAELAKICNLKIEKHRNGTLETFAGFFKKETQKWEKIQVLDKNTFTPLGANWRPVSDIRDPTDSARLYIQTGSKMNPEDEDPF